MANIKFTARGIAAIKPPAEGRTEYWDKGMPNFGLRVSSTGVKSWITMYRHKGRKRRHTLGTFPALTLADAYEMARQTRHEAAKGLDPAAEKKAERLADTFGELAHEYLERHAKKNKKSWKMDEYILNQDILPRWKNIKAKEVSRRDVRTLLDDVVGRGAPVHANRVLALVRKMFNFAIGREIVEHNPCAAMGLPTKPRSRDRVLSGAEIRTVWQSIEQEEPLIAAIFKLRLLTAQRGGEVESIAWNDLDLCDGIWTIPAERAKNGLTHRVPLSRQAMGILKELAESRLDSPWVFPSPIDKQKHVEHIQKAIQRVRSREDLEVDFRGHDLRRSAASHMASMGIQRLVISKVLNHVEKGITSVYDRHSYDAEKRDALQRWGDYLIQAVNKKEEVKVVPLARKKKAEKKEAALG